MFKVLVIHYSQSGQLTEVARSMIAPLEQCDDVEVTWQELRPVRPYPFPWPLIEFFDTFPECVYGDAPPNQPLDIPPGTDFDLVVIAYQVWFLSPSLPVTTFLQSEQAKRLLGGKPVITLIGCRNMWLSAQDRMKSMLTHVGARLVDNVVLVDQGPAWATFITTPRWVLTGKRNGFWGIFPPAGISPEDIAGASRFGHALLTAMPDIARGEPGPFLSGLKAVTVSPALIVPEKLGYRSFRIWGRLLRSLGKHGQPVRRAVLVFYIAFLVTLILTVVPLGGIIRAALKPIMRRKLEAQVRVLEAPSGSSDARMAEYRHREMD